MGWKFGRTTLTQFFVSSPSQNFRSVVSNLHQNFRSLFCNYSWEKNSSFPSRLLLLHFPFFFLGFFYHFSTGVGIGFRWELSRQINFLPFTCDCCSQVPSTFSLLEFHFQFKKKKKKTHHKSLPPNQLKQIPTPQNHDYNSPHTQTPPNRPPPSRRSFSGLSNEPAHTDLHRSRSMGVPAFYR
jgi:hypothetical protein